MRNNSESGIVEIFDAHTHFFSYTWLQHFQQLSDGKFKTVEALTEALDWELPAKDPVELGKRWVAEQDKHGLSRQVLFASKLNDAEFLTAAINHSPDRLTGYFMLNPKEENVRNQALYGFSALGMKGVLLFPAMFHFNAHDPAVYPVYEEALAASAPVFIHFGKLNIPIYQQVGLPDNIDLSYSDPLDLRQVAGDFPDLNFIVPHFGCGRFEEALLLASEHHNVYLDTSSSNSWIRPPLTLSGVFRKTLDTIGSSQIIFGTDSSFFPRGWRKEIFDNQFEILQDLGISSAGQEAIFSGNLKRILNLS